MQLTTQEKSIAVAYHLKEGSAKKLRVFAPLVCGSPRPQPEIASQPFHRWVMRDGSLWASFHREPSYYLVRFPRLADFQVSFDGSTVLGFPANDAHPDTVKHLYLNQVLPLALSRQDRLVLHGSAIENRDSAIAFLGSSGRGKSTLAASFAAHGTRFLTDDGLLLEQSGTGAYLVQPSHPSIRLWEDSRQAVLPATTSAAPAVDYTPKLRMLAGEQVPFCAEPRALQRIYVLGPESDTPSISPIRARDAVIEALRNCFLLDVEESAALRLHHQRLVDLAAHVPFFLIEYPRRFESLVQVRQSILDHCLHG